jgi:predicted nucleic acid-binding Zn ribbon protein
MERDNISELENLSDILKSININYNPEYQAKTSVLLADWHSVVGEKLAKYSSPKSFTDDGVLLVSCKNSVVANELFILRQKINKLLLERAEKNNIHNFKYIKITYG